MTNLQIFWFYAIGTDLNMALNCNKTFYNWSVLIPVMGIHFLIPMIFFYILDIIYQDRKKSAIIGWRKYKKVCLIQVENS